MISFRFRRLSAKVAAFGADVGIVEAVERHGRGCRTSRRPHRPSAAPAPSCRRTRGGRRSGRRTGRRPARQSCASRRRQSEDDPPSACQGSPRPGCNGERRIRWSTVGAFIGDRGDAFEEIGHVRSLMADWAARKRAWPASKAVDEGAVGVDGAGNRRQGGDLGPGAGGGHQRKARGTEGTAEIAGNRQLHRASRARSRWPQASSRTVTRRRRPSGARAAFRSRPAHRGSRGSRR